MTYPLVRQAQYALMAGFGALVSIEASAFAAITAKTPTFHGSWLIAGATIAIAVVALWLTCIGALRSDRRDRYRSTANSADRSGPVYTDIDGYMHVH